MNDDDDDEDEDDDDECGVQLLPSSQYALSPLAAEIYSSAG